jgi:Zn-dependent protease with chaperone function
MHQFSVIFQRFWVNFIFENFITFTSRLPYSRRLEEEADDVGLLLVTKVIKKYLKTFFSLGSLLGVL